MLLNAASTTKTTTYAYPQLSSIHFELLRTDGKQTSPSGVSVLGHLARASKELPVRARIKAGKLPTLHGVEVHA